MTAFFLQILVGLAAVIFFIWLIIPTQKSHMKTYSDDDVINPDDSQQIGFLVGMMGGDIADAAIARYALQRFEETHGCKATMRDKGVVVGMISAMK